MFQSPGRRKKIVFFSLKEKRKINLKLHFLLFVVWTILINNIYLWTYRLNFSSARKRQKKAKKSRKKNYDALWSKRNGKKSTLFASKSRTVHSQSARYSRCIFILTRHRLLARSFRRFNNYCFRCFLLQLLIFLCPWTHLVSNFFCPFKCSKKDAKVPETLEILPIIFFCFLPPYRLLVSLGAIQWS